MKVTWNWLSEFVELSLPLQQLTGRLDMAGLEVESTQEHGRGIADVRIAQVVSVKLHPQADRLKVCEVRTAASRTTVVCGAPNVAEGQRVAYVAPGAKLGDREISANDIRGVASAGMLCSEAELGLGPDDSGILILPADAPLGEPIAKYLRVEDTVLDISITPNRGDCLSVVGLAREIAALTGLRFHRPRVNVGDSVEGAGDPIRIRIEDEELCGRYVGRVLDGVQVGPSPLWLQYRLRAVGMRPINNVVDVTNYVMLERGQPLHAFDYDALPQKEIVVRRAGSPTKFRTLDDQERELAADDLLITTGAEVVAIAGVMGGANSEVGPDTKRILLESAWFAPASVRRTARRLGLRSEASFRFERDVDIEGVPVAADRATALIAQLTGARIGSARVDVYPSARTPAPTSLRLKRVEDLLGMSIPRTDIIARLKSLGASVSPATRGTLTVVPPSFRSDLVREIDLIEEIVRLTGYENVPETIPQCSLSGAGLSLGERREREVKRFLAAQGLTEVLPSSFCPEALNRQFPGFGHRPDPVKLRNPLSQGEDQMRLSLCSSLVVVAKHNLAQGNSEVGIFLIGKVFWDDGGYQEGRRLAGVVCPALAERGIGAARAAEFVDVKGILESLFERLAIGNVSWDACNIGAAFHPGMSTQINVGAERIGVLGALHPSSIEALGLVSPSWLFELDLDKVLQYCPPRVAFQELPRFPAVIRDLAILADDRFASDQVARFVRTWPDGVGFIETVQLFDEYSGAPIPEGKKSLAYSISYRSAERTLTDSEVNDLHEHLKEALTGSLKVQPR